jgi:hypothetical protein
LKGYVEFVYFTQIFMKALSDFFDDYNYQVCILLLRLMFACHLLLIALSVFQPEVQDNATNTLLIEIDIAGMLLIEFFLKKSLGKPKK